LHKKITTLPPANFESYSPSELFRFFFQIGHWTEGSFSDEFQSYTRGTLISTVTINKWKNRDVIPTRYSGPLFKMIETLSEPDIAEDWISAFETVWALHSAGRLMSFIRNPKMRQHFLPQTYMCLSNFTKTMKDKSKY